MTTAQLCARMPDVSQATVYRHVGLLTEAGLLEVAGEQRVRGFVERSYRLRRDRAVISADRAASATIGDHRQVFATAMAVLLAEFNAYLSTPEADPAGDLVGYRQHAIWLTPAERADLISALRDAIVPMITNGPGEGRSPYLLSPILFPMADPPE